MHSGQDGVWRSRLVFLAMVLLFIVMDTIVTSIVFEEYISFKVIKTVGDILRFVEADLGALSARIEALEARTTITIPPAGEKQPSCDM